MSREQTIEAIKHLITPTISEMGCTLAGINFEKEEAFNGSEALVIYIQKEAGIKIEDCVKVHKKLIPIIENSPFKNSFNLVVSSPGITESN